MFLRHSEQNLIRWLDLQILEKILKADYFFAKKTYFVDLSPKPPAWAAADIRTTSN